MAEDIGAKVFLRPGELFFGGPDDLVETILGSCVSITMWHPRYRVGGMCHYVVPRAAPGTKAPLGHDAPGALEALFDHAGRLCTHPRDYEVKIFGGGVQFAVDYDAGPDVGRRNVDVGLRLLAEHGLSVTTMDVLGVGARRVILDLGTGNVWVRRSEPRIDDLGATAPLGGRVVPVARQRTRDLFGQSDRSQPLG